MGRVLYIHFAEIMKFSTFDIGDDLPCPHGASSPKLCVVCILGECTVEGCDGTLYCGEGELCSGHIMVHSKLMQEVSGILYRVLGGT